MNDKTPFSESDLQAQLAHLSTLRAAIAQAIVGQETVVEQLLIGPARWRATACSKACRASARRLLVRSLGQALALQFRRVQFTPDLMPSDILGTELLEEDHGTGPPSLPLPAGPDLHAPAARRRTEPHAAEDARPPCWKRCRNAP
jgi:MoxR-like ATPase